MVVHGLLLLRGKRRQTTWEHRLLLLSHTVRTGSRLRDEQLLLRLLSGVQLHPILLHHIALIQHVRSNLPRHLHHIVGAHIRTNHSWTLLIRVHWPDLGISAGLLKLLLLFLGLSLLLLHLLFFSLLPLLFQLFLDLVDLLRQQVVVFRPRICHFVHIAFDFFRIRHQVVHPLVEHGRGIR